MSVQISQLEQETDNKMKLSFKTQFYPTEAQAKVLWNLSEQTRLMYNILLQSYLDCWKFIRNHQHDSRTKTELGIVKGYIGKKTRYGFDEDGDLIKFRPSKEESETIANKFFEINTGGCETKHNFKDNCGFKYITKFELYQTIKDMRNHEHNTDCSQHCKRDRFLWFQADYLDMSANGKLDANLKSWFSLRKNGHRDANPPRYKRKDQFSNLLYRRSMKINEKSIHLPLARDYPDPIDMTLRTEQRMVITKDGVKHRIQDYSVKMLDVSHDKGKWFASIIYELDNLPRYVDNGTYMAIDTGVSFLMTTIDTTGKITKIVDKKADQYWQKKIEEVTSKRDNCLTYYKHPSSDKIVRSNSHPNGHYIFKRSRKWKWYDKKKVQMERKKYNQILNFHHKESHRLIRDTEANTIIVGKLNIKKLKQDFTAFTEDTKLKGERTLHRRINIARFITFLKYKARLVGKAVIQVPEKDTTSTCSRCGKKRKMKLSDRIYDCDHCDLSLGRTVNSAINIYNKFAKEHKITKLRL